MNVTKHAELRINQRGFSKSILVYLENFLPYIYKNQGNKIFLTRKIARAEAKKLRNFANILEKHAGTGLILDSTGTDLITVYRKK